MYNAALCIALEFISLQRPIKEILHSYWLATHYDPKWYKAWHTWALANFEVVGYLESLTEDRSDVPSNDLAVHIVQAVEGWCSKLLWSFSDIYVCF